MEEKRRVNLGLGILFEKSVTFLLQFMEKVGFVWCADFKKEADLVFLGQNEATLLKKKKNNDTEFVVICRCNVLRSTVLVIFRWQLMMVGFGKSRSE